LSLNPVSEVKYRYRLALQHLERARRMLDLGDWPATVHYSQLAVENFAKSIISIYETPTWSHDPSNQLLKLLSKLPENLREEVRELVVIARELAAEHGRSSYGEPSRGLTPEEIYSAEDAREAVAKALRAKQIAEKALTFMSIEL